jgi:hypothetical protein
LLNRRSAVNHPGSDDVLNFARHDGRSSPDVAAHVQNCEACAGEVERLRSTIERLRRQATPESTPAPDCLDDAAVAALAGGEHLGEDRERRLNHASTCAYCRHRVATVARALSDPGVAAEIAATKFASRRPRLSVAFALASAAVAAAAVLFLVLPPVDGGSRGSHRAPTAVESTPPLIAPLGRVIDARLLRWGSMAGADRYRVTLFDTSGHVLYEAETTDTVISLPDTILLTSGRRYLWETEARTGWDRWSASKLAAFTITGADRR